MNTIYADVSTSPADADPTTRTGPVVGVTSTRIYCRTVCRPARAPKPENCVPFLDSRAARAAGYRACKLCRPDDAEWVTGPRARLTRERCEVRYGIGPTPIGLVLVASTERGVCGLYLSDPGDHAEALDRLGRDFADDVIRHDPTAADPVIARVAEHLDVGRTWDDIPLDLRGTPFQLRVWGELRAIPRGRTLTYGEVARRLGLPAGASRAVGTACGANPVSLLVPCHRVVRSDGGLGGYYWGLERKRALLDLEKRAVV